MKKTLVLGTATATVALTLGFCAARSEVAPALYGPPPDEDPVTLDDIDTDEDETDEPLEDVYGAPVVQDEEDLSEIAALYGPPPDEEPVAAEEQ